MEVLLATRSYLFGVKPPNFRFYEFEIKFLIYRFLIYIIIYTLYTL